MTRQPCSYEDNTPPTELLVPLLPGSVQPGGGKPFFKYFAVTWTENEKWGELHSPYLLDALIPPEANLLFRFGEYWTLPGRFSVQAVAQVFSFNSLQPEVCGQSQVGTRCLA